MTDDRTDADGPARHGEAADFVAPVDDGHGEVDEFTDGSDKGSYTGSSDFGNGSDAASNALREDGEYISDGAENTGAQSEDRDRRDRSPGIPN